LFFHKNSLVKSRAIFFIFLAKGKKSIKSALPGTISYLINHQYLCER